MPVSPFRAALQVNCCFTSTVSRGLPCPSASSGLNAGKTVMAPNVKQSRLAAAFSPKQMATLEGRSSQSPPPKFRGDEAVQLRGQLVACI